MTAIDHEILPEDLSSETRQVVDIIGMQAMMALAAKFPGERIYIPTPARLSLEARNRAIKAGFNGRNYRDLAIKYGLTPRWIRAIVDGDEAKSPCQSNNTNQRQMKLF